MAEAVSQAQVWQVVKPHLQMLLQRVIFPLLTFNEEDEALWEDDPEEVGLIYMHS